QELGSKFMEFWPGRQRSGEILSRERPALHGNKMKDSRAGLGMLPPECPAHREIEPRAETCLGDGEVTPAFGCESVDTLREMVLNQKYLTAFSKARGPIVIHIAELLG